MTGGSRHRELPRYSDYHRDMNARMATTVGMLILLVLPFVPTAAASGNAQSGVFSRTFDTNGLTLNITATYAKDWNWNQDNTVNITVTRVDGPANSSVQILDESAVLHRNGSDFVLARPQATLGQQVDTRASLAEPVSLVFSFSNKSYTANARQGGVYTAHIAVGVGMLVVSDKTSKSVYFANGPGEMLITLDTKAPGVHAQSDSFLYLVAAEVTGLAGIVFLMKAAKIGAKAAEH